MNCLMQFPAGAHPGSILHELKDLSLLQYQQIITALLQQLHDFQMQDVKEYSEGILNQQLGKPMTLGLKAGTEKV